MELVNVQLSALISFDFHLRETTTSVFPRPETYTQEMNYLQSAISAKVDTDLCRRSELKSAVRKDAINRLTSKKINSFKEKNTAVFC